MEVTECINNRTSVRKYSEKGVSASAIEKILESAIQAPSAGNAQDWEFIIVREEKNKKALSEAAFNQDFIVQAPVIIVVCSNLERITERYGERGRGLYSIQDTAAATQNLMLAAWDKGIGSCWVGDFNEQAVKEALILPEVIRPLAIVPLGYPQGTPLIAGRKRLKGMIHFERY